MPTDIEIYCNCIDRVRYHVGVADTVFAGQITTGDRDLNAELIFLHFRKALEEIAFASLSANRERYSAARAGFATEWNARRMLGFIDKIHPNFDPIPLKPPQETAPGQKFFDRVRDGGISWSLWMCRVSGLYRCPTKAPSLAFWRRETARSWSNRYPERSSKPTGSDNPPLSA